MPIPIRAATRAISASSGIARPAVPMPTASSFALALVAKVEPDRESDDERPAPAPATSPRDVPAASSMHLIEAADLLTAGDVGILRGEDEFDRATEARRRGVMAASSRPALRQGVRSRWTVAGPGRRRSPSAPRSPAMMIAGREVEVAAAVRSGSPRPPPPMKTASVAIAIVLTIATRRPATISGDRQRQLDLPEDLAVGVPHSTGGLLETRERSPGRASCCGR